MPQTKHLRSDFEFSLLFDSLAFPFPLPLPLPLSLALVTLTFAFARALSFGLTFALADSVNVMSSRPVFQVCFERKAPRSPVSLACSRCQFLLNVTEDVPTSAAALPPSMLQTSRFDLAYCQIFSHHLLPLCQVVDVLCVATSTVQLRVHDTSQQCLPASVCGSILSIKFSQCFSSVTTHGLFLMQPTMTTYSLRFVFFPSSSGKRSLSKFGVVLLATSSATSPKRGSTAARYATSWNRHSLKLPSCVPSKHDGFSGV